MNPFWKAQARRIDALSLRERTIMFVSIAAALGAVVDATVLSPAMAERRQLASQMRQATQANDALRAQLTARGIDEASPEGRQRAALKRARAEQAELDWQIREQLAGREELARLPAVLDRLLSRHERLTLTRLDTAGSPRPSKTESTPQTVSVGALPSVHWQGVDLSVAGSYADLVQYLAELEQALPGLRWGPLQIATPTQPPVLSVRLMLVGDTP